MKKALLLVLLVGGFLSTATPAHAAVNNIFFGGTCSNGWTDDAAHSGYVSPDSFGFWTNETSWTAYVDQRTSTATAEAALVSALNQLCLGSDQCYVYTYSQGGAIMSKAFADYTTAWNIVWVTITGNNEGGSELSSANWLAELVLGCSYASKVRPADNRPATGWIHNDTNGKTMYQRVGNITWSSALWWATSGLVPGEDDGVVSFASGGGGTVAGSFSNVCTMAKWTNHVISTTCTGYNLNHIKMKTRAICETGGYTSAQQTANCP